MHDGDGQDEAQLRPRAPRAGQRHAFGETSDPGAYVPRPATEAALASLREIVCDERSSAALCAPPGSGKTLLLHQVAQKMSDVRCCVYLPYGALETGDFCAWVLGRVARLHPALPAAGPADDPIKTLSLLSQRLDAAGRGLVLLIDDAGSLPLETARDLLDLTTQTRGALAAVLAVNDDAIGSRLVASAGHRLREVRFQQPMSHSETCAYVDARLALVAPCTELRARFDAASKAWIHRMSSGIPRRVHELANELLERPAHEVRTRIRQEPGVQDLLDDLEALEGPGLDSDLPELEYDLADSELEED